MQHEEIRLVAGNGSRYDKHICRISLPDVIEAKKEWEQYVRKTGRIYDRSPYKEPTPDFFFDAFFGEEDYDLYIGVVYDSPQEFVCDTVETANELHRFLKQFEFYDRYNQEALEFKIDGCKVTRLYSDW